MFDETRTKANVYVIEWKYEVEPLIERRRSTFESLDGDNDGSQADSNKASYPFDQSNLPNFKVKRSITKRDLKSKKTLDMMHFQSTPTFAFKKGMSPSARKKHLLRITTKRKEREES